VAFFFHGISSSYANPDASRAWFIFPQILRGVGTACLTVPLINQAVIGLKPQQMASGIALTNMLRQLGGAFGIAVMNTFISHRYMEHRVDLLPNLQLNDPELVQRLQSVSAGIAARGGNPATANQFIEFTLSRQSYLLSYLDCFILVSAFFLFTSPLLFLLKRSKNDKAAQAKIAEEAH
jgi:DHA2 family multidrug resistance protein